MAETKQQKFERLAERRVSELIERVRLVGNLSDRRNYEYKTDHVKLIFEAIESEIKAAKVKFKQVDEEKKATFSFEKLGNTPSTAKK